MARFRFKIVDSQGRRRSGVLRADSLEVAESALRSKLCQIVELTLLAEDGQAVELARLESSFSQVDRIRRALAVVLGCVFLFSFLSWLRSPSPEPSQPEPDNAVEFVVNGQVDTSKIATRLGGDLSGVRVHAVFPDLRYEVDGVLSEDGKSFSLPVSLVGVQRPSKVLIELSVDGERWAVPLGTPVSATGNVEVGQVTAEPPAEPPPLPKPISRPLAEAGSDKADEEQRKSPQEIKARQRELMRKHYERRGKGR